MSRWLSLPRIKHMRSRGRYLLQPITRRDFIHITVVIELADDPGIDQIFDLDVCGFRILCRHETADIAQTFERRKRLALNARHEILIAFLGDLWVVDLEPAHDSL